MNDVREDQIAFARSVNGGSSAALKKRPPIRAAVKKPEGHEAFLKMLETSKAKISLQTISDGARYVGVVRHSDKYTISIKPEGSGTLVFFKHAIEMFEPLDPAPKSISELPNQ